MEDDIILLIMSCEKYYGHKAKQQKETWLKEFPITYFHVIGNPELEKTYSFNFIDRILYIKVEDDYNSLPKKVIRSYDAINSVFQFKYIFKTDDDQNLVKTDFLINLKKMLLNSYNDENKRIHYGGHIVNVEKPYLSQYHKIHPELPESLPILQTKYSSGRFYFLSNFAVKWLLNKKTFVETEYLEDYAVGLNLHELFKKNILNLQSNKYFIDFA